MTDEKKREDPLCAKTKLYDFEPAEKLRTILCADVQRLDGESTKHKQIHRWTTGFAIVVAGVITVAAGAGLVIPGYEREFQFSILVLSAVATGVTAWAEGRRARDLWQHEREVYYALKDILRELDFRVGVGQVTLAQVEELFGRANAILGSSTDKWSRILEKKQEGSGGPPKQG